MTILEIKNLRKVYSTRFGTNKIEALRDVSFSVENGEYIAVMGESGSGKTTLLNILASLDKVTSGEVLLKGKNITNIKEKDMAAFRRKHLGYVFQDFNLLDNFSLQDNIFLPLVLAGKNYKEMEEKLRDIAEVIGIKKILEKYPYEVSGGEKQRAAIARAIITNPELLLADEPTGSLDSKTTAEILTLFSKINSLGQTIIMVTHSVLAASHTSRVLFIKDGKIFNQIYRGNMNNDDMYEKISNTLAILATGGNKNEKFNVF